MNRVFLILVVIGLCSKASAQSPGLNTSNSTEVDVLKQRLEREISGLSDEESASDSKAATNSNLNPPDFSKAKIQESVIPSVDASSDVVTWNGSIWNITNNRFLKARFEKYLNTQPEQGGQYAEYRKIIGEISDKLAPGNRSQNSVEEAWSLLPIAASFSSDSKLCDRIADAVYGVWLAKKERGRMDRANAALLKEMGDMRWNLDMAMNDGSLTNRAPKDENQAKEWLAKQQLKREMNMKPYAIRMEQIQDKLKAYQVKSAATEIEAKIQFQALVVQFFLQRRFQHIFIATSFYRGLFGDGDEKLRLGEEANKLFSIGSGVPSTLGVIDTLATEAVKDVEKGIEAYLFLVEQKKLDGASKRLLEAFAIGEHMPQIQRLALDKKQLAFEYTTKSNRLFDALEVKDYSQAEKLVKELENMASDFNGTKATSIIETARTISGMHIAKARAAAAAGERKILETELKEATEIWPRNPDLKEFSGKIFEQANIQQQALNDLERLLSQKNYRQIFDDKVKFIAATALYPEKQKQLGEVIDKMQQVEIAIAKASEVASQSHYEAAWEVVEKMYQEFPQDNKLNQVRANYTTRAAEFVKNVTTAQDLEKKGEHGSSLTWYLSATQIYPGSRFAKEGIERIAAQFLKDDEISPKSPPPSEGQNAHAAP